MSSVHPSLYKTRSHAFMARAFYVLSTLQIISFYVMSTRMNVDLANYFAGTEKLPFQERILPVFFLRPLLHFQPAISAFTHLRGVFLPPSRGAFFVLSLIAFSIAGYFTLKLYAAVSLHRTFYFLVYPAFLYTSLWSYMVLVQMNFSYPYDLSSLAFFTAGIYFIYTRQFFPLFVVVLVGTFNRETTLFLVVLYVIDSASVEGAGFKASLRKRFSLSQVLWLRVALLTFVWLTIKLALYQRFAHNNASESYLRIGDNLYLFLPKHWPALINICGYILPIVFIFRGHLAPRRFANYLLVFPVWFAVMVCEGVLVETRIYGELSAYTAVAAVLLIESAVARIRRPRSGSHALRLYKGIGLRN